MGESEEREGPPALPGEVWRGDLEDDGAWLCAVAVEHGRVKTFAFGEREGWVEQSRGAGYAILAAWAMAERARADTAETGLDRALEQRDRYEEQIGDIAAHVGCPDEWSNLHSHATCIEDAFDALRARAEKAETRLADVERELADFRAVARGRM